MTPTNMYALYIPK